MSSLRNLIRRRIHKERAQPRDREKFGLLEKKKDYKLRAIDYHRKQDHLHKLRKKAAFRNPDEFYFQMHSSQTEDGIHVKRRKISRTQKEMKNMNTQDLNYLTMKRAQEDKRIQSLKSSLNILDGEGMQEEKNTHTIFVDKPEDMLSFDAAKHFETTPEMLKQKYNRVKLKDMEKAESNPEEKANLEKLKKKRTRLYKTLKERIERKRKIEDLMQKVQTQRNLMGKGPRRKIITKDEFGEEDKSKTIYKWKMQRKK